MKSTTKHLTRLACAAALCATTAYGSEPLPFATPAATPSATPRPTASPAATPTPAPRDTRGQVSLRGLYQGLTPSGATAMFYIEGNAKLQAHILDTVNQAIHVAEGELTNGAFSLTLSNGENISGTASEAGIAVALNRVPFQASRVSIFGADMKLGGRYFGVAHNPNGTSRVTLQMDANRNVVLVQETGTTLTGGSGKAEPSQAASNRFTFTLDRVIGGNSPVTGSFTLSDGVLEGSFTNPAGTFTFTSHKKALANRLANISTRGLVGPGQGQLIGGFIITGGPKLVLIRAVGPSLAAAGVSPALADPALELFSGSTMIGSNDNWKNNENAAQIVSTGVAPTNDVEAALLVRLEEGAYTPVVTGTGDGNGIALVEIYELGSE